MKKPEYTLKKDIKTFPAGPMQDPIEYPAGTLVQPFWNTGFVPDHIKERFKKEELPLHNFRWEVKEPEPTVICLIGSEWLEIPIKDIRTNQ